MDLNTIYLICAVAGGTVLVLRILLMLIGIQGDTDMDDAGGDMDGEIGEHGGAGEVNLVSIQSLSGFFTMFGLVGMGLLRIHASDVVSLLGALGSGLLTAWATAMIVFTLQKLQSSGTVDVKNAIGQQGTVYLTIPEQGTGVVSVTVQGALRQFDAISENGIRIPTGAIVRVTGISAGKLVVNTES